MAWDEAKRQAARERMARARAMRKPKAGETDAAMALQDRATQTLEAPEQPNAPDLVLTVRRLRVGSFTGLWELGRVMPDGSIKIITDANTKQLIINLARNEILKCGQ